jgi:glutaredoxin
MVKRKVEIFTAGCAVCKSTEELVEKLACDSCEIIVYDLNKDCETNECRELAHKYGVNRVPAVVVNGTLLECCKLGSVSEAELRKAGIGNSL